MDLIRVTVLSGWTLNNYPYFFPWRNNPKRAQLHGRSFRVIARSGRFDWTAVQLPFVELVQLTERPLPTGLNSAWVEFENGQQEVISRNAIRKHT